MSGSVTPWALGMSPAISCPVCRRLPPAAWDQRSIRLWRTEATSAASARDLPATSCGRAASTSRPRASASRNPANSGPRAALAATVARSSSESPERARRASQRSACASVANVRYSAESRSMPSASCCSRRIISWAATSAPSLRSTPTRTPFGRHWLQRFVVGGLRVGVVVGVHVEAVGLLAPGGRDVEDLSGGRRTDHGVRRVDRPTLRPMSGRGIGELDMLTHVVSRHVDLPDAITSLQGQRAVGM